MLQIPHRDSCVSYRLVTVRALGVIFHHGSGIICVIFVAQYFFVLRLEIEIASSPQHPRRLTVIFSLLIVLIKLSEAQNRI